MQIWFPMGNNFHCPVSRAPCQVSLQPFLTWCCFYVTSDCHFKMSFFSPTPSNAFQIVSLNPFCALNSSLAGSRLHVASQKR